MILRGLLEERRQTRSQRFSSLTPVFETLSLLLQVTTASVIASARIPGGGPSARSVTLLSHSHITRNPTDDNRPRLVAAFYTDNQMSYIIFADRGWSWNSRRNQKHHHFRLPPSRRKHLRKREFVVCDLYFSRTTICFARFHEAIRSDSSTGALFHACASVKMLGLWKCTGALPSRFAQRIMNRAVFIPSTNVIQLGGCP